MSVTGQIGTITGQLGALQFTVVSQAVAVRGTAALATTASGVMTASDGLGGGAMMTTTAAGQIATPAVLAGQGDLVVTLMGAPSVPVGLFGLAAATTTAAGGLGRAGGGPPPVVTGTLSSQTVQRGDHAILTIMLIGVDRDLAAAEFTLKRRLDDPDPGVVQKTLFNGGIVSSGTPVTALAVSFAPADLAWVDYRDSGFFFDCQLSFVDGSGPVTVVAGRLRVRLDATRQLT